MHKLQTTVMPTVATLPEPPNTGSPKVSTARLLARSLIAEPHFAEANLGKTITIYPTHTNKFSATLPVGEDGLEFNIRTEGGKVIFDAVDTQVPNPDYVGSKLLAQEPGYEDHQRRPFAPHERRPMTRTEVERLQKHINDTNPCVEPFYGAEASVKASVAEQFQTIAGRLLELFDSQSRSTAVRLAAATS